MLPLSYIINLISAAFCFFAAVNLYLSYRQSKSANVNDFFKAYLCLGLYYGTVALPGFFHDPSKVQIIFIITYIPGILSGAFLFRIAFRLLGRPSLSYYFIILCYGIAIAVTILNIIYFAPAHIERSTDNLFFNWVEGTPLWLRIFIGSVIGLLIMGCSVVFSIGGFKSRGRDMRLKAFLVAGGLLGILLAVLFYFIIEALFTGMTALILDLAATLFGPIGILMMLIGIRHKGIM